MNSPASESPASLAALTPREREVLHWLAEGKTSYETGVILGCSEATVKKHRSRIYLTLGVPNATSAARFYLDATAMERTALKHMNSPVVDSRAVVASLSKVAANVL